MKKLFTLIVASGMALTVGAQQLPNGHFDSWKTACGSTEAFDNDETFRQRPGVEPESWNGSSVHQKVFMTVKKELVFNDNNAVKLVNAFVGMLGIGSNAPAFLTLGTPWVAASTDIPNCDGGVYGGVEFTHQPDSIKGRFQRTDNTGESSHIIAYLWNGTFKSMVGMKNAADKERENVDRAIMGRGEATAAGQLVASCDYTFTTTANNDWQTISVPLVYSEGADAPTMMNIVISAADYWDRGNMKENTTLLVDDVEFVYNKDLMAISFDDQSLAVPVPGETTDATAFVYDENADWTFTTNGRGAKVVKEFDANSNVLTVTVYGDDCLNADGSVKEDATNFNTYKFLFKEATAKLSSLTVNGESLLNETNRYYSIRGEYDAEQVAYTTEDGAAATVDAAYDAATRILQLTVTAGGKNTVYYVKYVKDAAAFQSKLFVNMSGALLGAPAQDVEMTEPVQNGESTTIDLQLLNFELLGQNMGDIYLTDVVLNEDGSLYKKIDDGSFSIFGDAAEMINPGITSIELNGQYTDVDGVWANGILEATISITWAGTPINVTVIPPTVTSIDLTGQMNAGVLMQQVKNGLKNPNCLVYIDKKEEATDSLNVVFGDSCALFVLTDGYEFNAPKAFRADTVRYSHPTVAGEFSAFVLPFAAPATDINGKVYRIAGMEGNKVNFETVSGTLEANRPYFVQLSGDSLLNTFLKGEVAAMPETLTDGNGDASLVGTFSAVELASDAAATFYRYNGELLAKEETVMLQPFEAILKVANATEETLVLSLDGEVTGIGSIENGQLNGNADVDVYDLNGRLVRKSVKAATALQGLPAGTYIVGGKKVLK